MRKFLIGLVGCLVLSTQANAEGTANQFLTNSASDVVEATVGGLGNGISWANTYAEVNRSKPIYCPPANLAITAQQYMEILRQHVRKYPEIGEKPAGYALLRALIGTFPCSK